MVIRSYEPGDCGRLAELFYQTVHHVNAKDYSGPELDAWATGTVDMEEWNRSFLEHFTLVAEEEDVIVGFGDMDQMGHLDRLYVHKDYQRRGIATALCDELEKFPKSERLTTHASITARPFFERRGYRVAAERRVERNGVPLTQYVMEKR